MTLEDWLKQDRSLADQLRVMEGLCGALNDGQARGALHRGLEPATIEVESDGSCDLTAALAGGGGASRYRAPEVAEGAAHSAQADIYSAGVIFYEMLSGRSPAPDRPTPLADLRPDVPRDLTDAVMGCLEKGPDWRPKDLSYLLQVVRSLRGQGAGKSTKAPARATEAPRSGGGRATAPSARRAAKGGSTSNAPLFVAVALLLVGAGVGAWFWLKSPAPPAGGRTAAARPTPAPVTTTTLAAAAPAPSATPTPAALATPATGPTPTPVTEPARPAQTPTPPPTTLAPRAAEPTPTPTPTPVPTPTPAPVQTQPAAETPAVVEPTVLTAVSPLQVKRGGTTILDVRGTGLRATQKATILKVKEAPNGISVVRQRFVSSGLVQVILKLEENAATGAYGLSMSDSGGGSNSLSFTVSK